MRLNAQGGAKRFGNFTAPEAIGHRWRVGELLALPGSSARIVLATLLLMILVERAARLTRQMR